ncbi:MAG: pectin esterase [Mediterranea massiliensis]|nr:pectin esterase [Mediterranea massiliensis]
MKRFTTILLFCCFVIVAVSANSYKRKILVAQDGTGDYTTITEAIENIRAFMDYKVTVCVKKGIYKEKIVLPEQIENVDFVGEDVENTVITFDDHANINKMGTFRTFTFKVAGNNITFRNLTIENNAPLLGQAVALHTEGTRLAFINCRFLGNQDTIYTGGREAKLLFLNCYIEGTTDFIFGPATALFRHCLIHCKRNSYITAASTPKNVAVGYVFHRCRITADSTVNQVYLGRPWRPYGFTLFMHCELGDFIKPEGWNNWRNAENEKTARYAEYENQGKGAMRKERVKWAKQLTSKEALKYKDMNYLFEEDTEWFAEVIKNTNSISRITDK